MRYAHAAAVALAILSSIPAPLEAAQRLVATVAGPTFTVTGAPVSQSVTFGGVSEPISGVGLTAQFTGVNVDNSNGLYPWSLDLKATITAPGGASMNWGPKIGGDTTIAAFPLQDYSKGGFANVGGNGTFNWQFALDATVSPYSASLSNVQYHLTTTAPDVTTSLSSNLSGAAPTWNRPYFIAGVSGLGPVKYNVVPFTVTESGGYDITSVVSQGDGFNFLYAGSFNASQPLANLLDYGLGNGSAPNGSPAGTSLISSMLLEGTTYYLVTSQWANGSGNQNYLTNIVGPGSVVVPEPATLLTTIGATMALIRRRR